MKKNLLICLIILLVFAIAFGIWGYIEALNEKNMVKKVKNIVEPTLVLSPVGETDIEDQINNWQVLSERSADARTEIKKLNLSDRFNELKANLEGFYNKEKTSVKLNEALYFKKVVDMENEFQLTEFNKGEMSKGELDEYRNDLKSWGNEISSGDLTLPPKHNQSLKDLEDEYKNFLSYLDEVSTACETDDCQVFLETGDFNSEVKSFKKELKSSLSLWVEKEETIKNELDDLKINSWLNPL